MLVEIKGVEFSNKGAELMLHATVEAIKKHRPDWNIVLVPGHLSPYQKRIQFSAWQKFSFRLLGVDWTFLGHYMPATLKRLLGHFGIVAEADIDVVFDASGFVYSDKWGSARLKGALAHVERTCKHSKSYVFLPQAFGPFEVDENRSLMSKIVHKAQLICARDKVSFDGLTDLMNKEQSKDKVKKFPDITTLVDVSDVQLPLELPEKFIAIVPNSKMFWRKSGEDKSRYLEFITQAVLGANILGFRAVLINHEGEKDRKMCKQLVADIELSGVDAPMFIDGLNALEVKKIIGMASLCVSSRFHGCVSSLSQAVPTLATSWGHKYEQLFALYGCEGQVLSVDDAYGISERMEPLLEDKQLVARLKSAASAQKQQTISMWQEVFALVDSFSR